MTSRSAHPVRGCLEPARAPDLHFDLLAAHAGVNGLAVYYRTNLTGKTVVEVLALGPGGRFSSGDAHNAV